MLICAEAREKFEKQVEQGKCLKDEHIM